MKKDFQDYGDAIHYQHAEKDMEKSYSMSLDVSLDVKLDIC